LQEGANFSLGHSPLRVSRMQRSRELNDLALNLIFTLRLPFDGRALPPQPAQSLVHGDTGKPSCEPRVGPKGIESREGTHIGLLDDVLGLAVIAKDAPSDPVEPAVVPACQDPNRRFVTTARAAHQLLIAQQLGIGFLMLYPGHVSLLHI